MIQNHDRSGWFGASDTERIMQSWNTKTFAKWWAAKLGITHNRFTTPAMRTGTAYEHKILREIGVRRVDRQIKIPRLRIRVNLDGEDRIVHEVKTHKGEFKVSKAYWMQCQVEMLAALKPCEIVAYKLGDDEYENYFLPIDHNRISYHWIDFDPEWILNEYLPRIRHLKRAMRKGERPNEAAVQKPGGSHGGKQHYIDRIRVSLAERLIERASGRYVRGDQKIPGKQEP